MLNPTPLVRSAVLVAASMSASLALAAEPLDQLAWLAGCWNSEGADPGSGEQWMPIAGGTLLGMARTVRGGKTVAYEFMRIANAADGKLAFFAQPSGKAPAAFPLLRLGANEVAFENPEHEFPQRVIYRLESAARLRASIEGVRNGTPRSIDFPMVRVSCDALTKGAATP
jgi:hypothetical protein